MKRQLSLMAFIITIVMGAAFTPGNNFQKEFNEAVTATKDVVCYASKAGIAPDQFESKSDTDPILRDKLKKAHESRIKIMKYADYKEKIENATKIAHPDCTGCQGACYGGYFACMMNHGDEDGRCTTNLYLCLSTCCISGACACS